MIERLSGPLSPSIARGLADLQVLAYADIGIRPWTADQIEASGASPHVHLLMARDGGGTLKGFLLLRLLDGEGEILSLAVDPSRRRQGIASRLIDETKNGHEIARAKRIVLEVAKTNTGAISLYRMLGFVDIATRRDYYRIDGALVDACLMERRSR